MSVSERTKPIHTHTQMRKSIILALLVVHDISSVLDTCVNLTHGYG